MKKSDIIEHLNGLICYAKDYISMSEHDKTCECADVWEKDARALASAILAVNMLSDIFENLEGQDMFGEMISVLNKMGYGPEDFADLGICSFERAQQCIEDYNDEF